MDRRRRRRVSNGTGNAWKAWRLIALHGHCHRHAPHGPRPLRGIFCLFSLRSLEDGAQPPDIQDSIQTDRYGLRRHVTNLVAKVTEQFAQSTSGSHCPRAICCAAWAGGFSQAWCIEPHSSCTASFNSSTAPGKRTLSLISMGWCTTELTMPASRQTSPPPPWMEHTPHLRR